MLTTLIRYMTRNLPVTLKEANNIIELNTEKLYLCKESHCYNAKLVFVTGEEITVSVDVLFKNKG
jgi:hypothetical protein